MPRKTKHLKRRVSRKQNLLKKRRQTVYKRKGSQNRTKRGGKKYGQGAKGALFDIYLAGNTEDKDTLIEMIGNNSTITLYKYIGKTSENIEAEAAPPVIETKESPSTDKTPGQENPKEPEIDKHEYIQKTIDDFNVFSNWLKTEENNNRLAKVFTEENAFLDELKENSNVYYKTLNEDSGNISALEPNYTLNEFEFSGVEIELENKTKKYVLFTKKCIPYPYYILTDEEISDLNRTIKKNGKTYYNVNMKQFMIEILQAIHKVNTDKFYHNDIKLSNAVYDPDNKKMKLIDWGAGKTIPDDYNTGGLNQIIYRGDPIFSSLYKMYIRYTTPGDGVSKTAAERNMYYIGPKLCRVCNVPSAALKTDAVAKKKKDLNYYSLLYLDSTAPPSQKFATHSIEKFLDYQSDTFQKQLRSISQNPNDVKENDIIKRKLFEYRKSFDLHMFGMTIFHAVYIFDLDPMWIDKYAIPFTNLDPTFPNNYNYLEDTMGKIKKCIEELQKNSISTGKKVSEAGYWNGLDGNNKSIFSKSPRIDKINPLNFFKSK